MTGARILVVDDEPDIRELVREILEEEGYAVTVAADAGTARRARIEERPDLALLDIWMPDVDGITLLEEWQSGDAAGVPVIMMSGHGTIETAVEATRLGAFDYVEKPLSLAKLLLTVRSALGSAQPRVAAAATGVRAGAARRADLVGSGRVLAALRERVARLAGDDGPVLVRGEPGSGKRTVAQLLHEQGPRADGPRVLLDVGRVGTGAAADALFGTDGTWPQAAGGTLVIDDLAELDGRAQAQLLERLERTEAQAPRVVALSAEDLSVLIEARQLRPDLYHALNATVVQVPALREHAEDVPDLLEHFVNRLVELEGLGYRHFAVPAQNRLRHYDWPGNVAELVGLVRRLLVLGDGVEIDVAEVDAALAELRPRLDVPATAMALPLELPLRQARETFERAYLQHQLRAVGGRIGELARRVGMERTHLYRKLKSLGIDYGGRERR